MKPHPVAIGALALLVTAVCVAAGFWQLSRLAGKRALNAARAAALAAPAAPLAREPGGRSAQAGRKVVVAGEYDAARHVLLTARFHDSDLGVELLTPLRLDSGGSLLVDRGWLEAQDGLNAAPAQVAEPGQRRVTGVLVRVPARAGLPPWRRLAGAGEELWSTHELDSASVAAYLPGVPPSWLLLALPDSAAPVALARTGPPMLDEQVHLSYAIQWFCFALITAVGTLVIARRERRRRRQEVGPGRSAPD
ncbi:MAG: SURF1 family protein [Candidatus Eisenbacteria bacterium]|nr:SURF1 family protein [Candidatus Eisenbacteria bacterium]